MKSYLSFLLFSLLLIASTYTVIKNVYSQQSNTVCFDDKNNSIDTAPTIASYDIIIPFTNKNQTTFEPMEINLPINTQVRWINLDNTPHNVIITRYNNANIYNTSSLGNPLFEKVVSLGELITYNFTKSGIYNYFDKKHPNVSGTIIVGDVIQKGEYMSMHMGTNFPINSTELKRIVFLIEPNLETNIQFPRDLPLSYNFTINNPYGHPIYNKKIIDADGKLFFELIPQPSPIYINSFLNSSILSNAGIISNTTKVGSFIDFVTWGFVEEIGQKQQEEGEQTKNCLKGTLHIKGPVLVDIIKNGIKIDKPYSIQVDILATNENNKLSKPISDTFIIPNQ